MSSDGWRDFEGLRHLIVTHSKCASNNIHQAPLECVKYDVDVSNTDKVSFGFRDNAQGKSEGG